MNKLFGLFLVALAFLAPGSANAGCIIGGDVICVTAGGFTPSCSQSTAFLARATAVTNNTDKTNYDTLICGLETDGVGCSNTLDFLYILAAPDSATYLLNLCSSSFALTVNGTGTFTANQGWAGNGSTGFLDTNFIPSTNAVFGTLNSAQLGVYDRTNRASANTVQAGGVGGNGSHTYIATLNAGNQTQTSINSSSFPIATNVATQGAYTSSRTSSSAHSVYKNSSSTTLTMIGTLTSNSLSNGKIFISANNNGGATQFSSDQLAAAWYGAGVTGANSVLIQNRINTFMTAYGTNVY